MPIITVLIVVIAIGFLLWLADRYIPMEPTVKRVLIAIVVIALIFWLLNVFGIWQLILGATV